MLVCPNKNCIFNEPKNAEEGGWFTSHGSYDTAQHQKLHRYQCKFCHTTFSERRESHAFHLHRDDIDEKKVFTAWCSGVSIAELSRRFNCSEIMIRTRIRRYRDKTYNFEVDSKGLPTSINTLDPLRPCRKGTAKAKKAEKPGEKDSRKPEAASLDKGKKNRPVNFVPLDPEPGVLVVAEHTMGFGKEPTID